MSYYANTDDTTPVIELPTIKPVAAPTHSPTTFTTNVEPSFALTYNPTSAPIADPTFVPTIGTSPIPTYSPTTSAPIADPTSVPTAGPSLIPTYSPSTSAPIADPTSVPTAGPSLIPTYSPTTFAPIADPSSVPTAGPSLIPTYSPSTSAPIADPSSVPTAGPSLIPTYSPTISTPIDDASFTPTTELTSTSYPSFRVTFFHSAHLRGAPTYEPSENIAPSISPTQSVVSMKVSYRIQKIYDKHKEFLANSEAGEHIRSFLNITSPTREDIKYLRNSLNQDEKNTYENPIRYGTLGQDALGYGKLWLFLRIDYVLKIAEINYGYQKVGFSPLYNNFQTQNNGSITHYTTVSGALGSGNITKVIQYGNKTLTDIIGNNQLAGITILNITSNEQTAGGITAYITSLTTKFSQIIGTTTPLFDNPVVINECDSNSNIISEIYSASDSAIVHGVNGFLACSNFAANHNSPYYITCSGSLGCTLFNETDSLLKGCNSCYLQPHDEL